MDSAEKTNYKVADQSKTFAVVLFPNEKRKGKKLVDLVPHSWLSQTNDDEWKCYYPPKDDITVSTLIMNGNPPNLKWKQYKAEILKTAVSYSQGLRRLNRACVDSNIDSTSACSDDSAEGNNAHQDAENLSDQNDISSTTSSSPKRLDTTVKKAPVSQKHQQILNSSINTPGGSSAIRQISSDSETSTIQEAHISIGTQNRGLKRKRHSETGEEKSNRSPHKIYSEIMTRMDKVDERMEKIYKSLAKQIKGAKQSVLYDLNKKMDAMKNTIIVNRGPGLGKSLKKYKETLGVKLPIETYDAFIEFDAMIKTDDDKQTALKEIMADMVGAATQTKEAVRKILGSLIMKAVQEMYSGTGRKGPNGITKKNFSGTHVYVCMKDIIQDKLETADGAGILTATSRYLAGAGDREGGKAQRDAKKVIN